MKSRSTSAMKKEMRKMITPQVKKIANKVKNKLEVFNKQNNFKDQPMKTANEIRRLFHKAGNVDDYVGECERNVITEARLEVAESTHRQAGIAMLEGHKELAAYLFSEASRLREEIQKAGKE